jgi:ABC-type multidrug transport system ATPase subunit
MSELAQVAVRAEGLVKHYGDVEAVRGVDLCVERGEVFGFLGPNGAGKSSTMRMIGCEDADDAAVDHGRNRTRGGRRRR